VAARHEQEIAIIGGVLKLTAREPLAGAAGASMGTIGLLPS